MTMKMNALTGKRKSQVFISAIIVLTIVLALGTALLFHSRSFRDITRLQLDTDKAYSLARSGMGIAQRYIGDHSADPTMNATTYNLGQGNITTEITFNQDTRTGNITSTGRIGRSVSVLAKNFSLPSEPPSEPPPESGAHWTLVDDAVPDGDATYVYATTSKNNWNGVYSADAYQVEDPPVGMSTPIGTVRTTVQYEGCVRTRARLNGTNGIVFSSGQCGSYAGSYGSATSIIYHPISPYNPDAWTWDNIRDMQVVLELAAYSPYVATGKVTQLLVQVYDKSSVLIVTLRPNGTGDYTNIEGPPPP